MKRHTPIIILILLALAVIGIGCEAAPQSPAVVKEPQEEAPKVERNIRIAFCASHQENEFIRSVTQKIRQKAEAAGATLEVHDASQSAEKQVGQVGSLIRQGIDGILIEPVDKETLAPAIEACKNAGIPVITFNQRVANQALATSFVGVDMIQGGVMEMEQVVRELGAEGTVVILHGPMGSDAQVGRSQGYEQVLSKYPGIHVLAQQSASWVRGDAFQIAENWIQSGLTPKAIVSENDDMALGALKAVEEAGLSHKVKVYGLDATPEGLQAVAEGRLRCTISQNGSIQAETAVSALLDAIDGKPVLPEYKIDHWLITQETAKQLLKQQ